MAILLPSGSIPGEGVSTLTGDPDVDYPTFESLQVFSYSNISSCSNTDPSEPMAYIAAEFSDDLFPDNGLYTVGDEDEPNDREDDYTNGRLCPSATYTFFLRTYSVIRVSPWPLFFYVEKLVFLRLKHEVGLFWLGVLTCSNNQHTYH